MPQSNSVSSQYLTCISYTNYLIRYIIIMFTLKNIARIFNKFSTAKSAKPYITQLKNRSIISVAGKDSKKLLQGIISNDIEIIKDQPKCAMYTTFLNVKGRAITDALIFNPIIFQDNKPVRHKQQFWMDIDSRSADNLLKHIKKYTWKKDVQVDLLEDQPKTYVIYNHQSFHQISDDLLGTHIDAESTDVGEQGNYSNLSFYDPRVNYLGIRLIASSGSFDMTPFDEVDVAGFEEFQILHGIVEGNDMFDKIPFQFNVDLFNGISFTKGCYLGQQLISRAYHTGVVRKRIFPIVFEQQLDENTKLDTPIVNSKGTTVGKILKKSRNFAIGLIDYLQLNDEDVQIESPGKGMIINIYQDKINQYITMMKNKQESLDKLL